MITIDEILSHSTEKQLESMKDAAFPLCKACRILPVSHLAHLQESLKPTGLTHAYNRVAFRNSVSATVVRNAWNILTDCFTACLFGGGLYDRRVSGGRSGSSVGLYRGSVSLVIHCVPDNP